LWIGKPEDILISLLPNLRTDVRMLHQLIPWKAFVLIVLETAV
jgi:hypothetical protein